MKGVKATSSANSLLPPIRQTASIFKQPVTVVKVSEENNVKTDPGTKTAKTKDKPRQLFWEKRLDGISAQNPEDALLGMELPPGVRSLGVVEDSSTNTLLASISTALHLGHGPVKGQVGGGGTYLSPLGFFVARKRPIFRISLSLNSVIISIIAGEDK